MTLDVYADLFDDDLDAVAERLDAATRKPGVPVVRPRRQSLPSRSVISAVDLHYMCVGPVGLEPTTRGEGLVDSLEVIWSHFTLGRRGDEAKEVTSNHCSSSNRW
jgi:hypothetical protein